MILTVQGKPAYAYTGGKPFDASLPTAVFIHGAEHDHSVWALQTRYFAHHGFGVLAVDLPGHCRSAGPALTTVPAMADWLAALLDAAGVQRAFVAGHSMGSLIALDFAGRYPERATHLALLATAIPMTVSDALLDAALQSRARCDRHGQPMVAFDVRRQTVFPRARLLAARHEPAADGARLGNAANPTCSIPTSPPATAYADGLARAAQVRCAIRLIVGRRDAMTPPRAARALADALAQAGVPVDTITLEAGHALMTEQPDATLDALFSFASKRASRAR